MSEKKLTILVVEDNPDNRTLITDVLSMDYTIVEAGDGAEGVEKAGNVKPALILMDLSLPKKDGWQATREIKADPEIADIPVIALTAHAMVGDRERALEAGCDGYVTKPINFVELRRVLAEFLDGA